MATFDLADLDRQGLNRRHKIAIAECIIAWAHCESMFRAMLTAIEQRALDDGAKSYNRLQFTRGWSKLEAALNERGASEAVLEKIKEHRKDFEEHVEARNMIAHAGCVGTRRSDPDYLVFAPFEAFGDGELTINLQPIQVIENSTRWARGFAEMANRILEAAGH